VKEDTYLKVVYREVRQILVESWRFPVEFDQQKLVDPVKNNEMEESNWIKNWDSAWVREDTPKSGEELRINIERSDLLSDIKSLNIGLKHFFRS